jgi:colanic acid/amylovoran biosynthesis glycosyltransferase
MYTAFLHIRKAYDSVPHTLLLYADDVALVAESVEELQALALLKDDLPFTYTIAGDGDQRAELEALTDALGLRPRVTFFGAVSQTKVPQLLAEADVFVHPCVTAKNGDQEGLPLTIKEAMARGVPVVGSTHGGMGEMITHGVDGLLAPEHDVPTLADLLKQVMAPTPESTALRQSLSTAARHTVESRYDVAILNRTLFSWLKESPAA